MKKITEQLTSFYKAKGYKGAVLNSCVKKDLKRLEHTFLNVPDFTGGVPGMPGDSASLAIAFAWDYSPEGHEYWQERDMF